MAVFKIYLSWETNRFVFGMTVLSYISTFYDGTHLSYFIIQKNAVIRLAFDLVFTLYMSADLITGFDITYSLMSISI